MAASPPNTQRPLGLIALGLPGFAIFLGGLFVWFVFGTAFASGLTDWERLSKAPRLRLITLLVAGPLAPPVGFAMMVFAANLMEFKRYLRPRQQALQLALLDAAYLTTITLTACALILTLAPWGGYPFAQVPTLISSGAALILAWVIRRFTRAKLAKWQSQTPPTP